MRFTTSRLRPQKPTPPNEPLLRSANRSGLSFIGKAAHRQIYQRQAAADAAAATRFGFHPDDTTPIPRPSRYYGGHQKPLLSDQLQSQSVTPAPPLAPSDAGALPRQDRQKRSRLARTQAPTRQIPSALRGFPALPCLRPAAERSPPSALRTAACVGRQSQRRVHRSALSGSSSTTSSGRQ